MKLTFTFLLSIFLLGNVIGQSSDSEYMEVEKAEVLKIIVKLFDGMRAGDSTMVRSCFDEKVDMFTSYTNKKGEPVLVKDDVEKFIHAVGTPHDKVWDEKIWGTEIRISDNLAQVWTEYAFYAGEEFSHCGVDAFLLSKTKDGWKIFHLSDTRQRKNCKQE